MIRFQAEATLTVAVAIECIELLLRVERALLGHEEVVVGKGKLHVMRVTQLVGGGGVPFLWEGCLHAAMMS